MCRRDKEENRQNLCKGVYREEARGVVIENIIYREELKESLDMNFTVPFSLKGSSKCTNHVNVHKLYAVEYINTVCSLEYSFQFRMIFQGSTGYKT